MHKICIYVYISYLHNNLRSNRLRHTKLHHSREKLFDFFLYISIKKQFSSTLINNQVWITRTVIDHRRSTQHVLHTIRSLSFIYTPNRRMYYPRLKLTSYLINPQQFLRNIISGIDIGEKTRFIYLMDNDFINIQFCTIFKYTIFLSSRKLYFLSVYIQHIKV